MCATKKNKVTLMLKKPAYIGMCVLELSRVLCMNSIKITFKINMTTDQNYYSQKLIVSMKIFEDFSSNKDYNRVIQNTMIILTNYSLKK